MANLRSNLTWDEPYSSTIETGIECGLGAGLADNFYPGEPIGLPSQPRGRLRKLVVISVIGGCGWAAVETQDQLRPWWNSAAGMFATANVATPLSQAATSPLPPTSPELPPLQEGKEVVAIPGPQPSPPVIGATMTSQQSHPQEQPENAQKPEDPISAAPLPKPEVDPNDPYQKRAIAVGLHPDLSRVLLSSMSEADYRNAGVAIRKALAEASDSEKFIWPPERKATMAVFQVHFVTGDRQDCRRYIVTVVKNGWTTTAPPMEKCGLDRKRSANAEHHHATPRPM
jgi:hypothetical protein